MERHWPGAGLVSAAAWSRAAHRQRRALIALALAAAPAAAFAGIEPAGVICVIALAGALIESAVIAGQDDRRDRCADELISLQYPHAGRSDPVSVAVRARLGELGSVETRARLACDLRWWVNYETTPTWRHAQLPPIRGLAPHRGEVERIAAALERSACDPRAIIRLRHLLATGAFFSDPNNPDDVGARLGEILQLLSAGRG
jgi:hypothetical protein